MRYDGWPPAGAFTRTSTGTSTGGAVVTIGVFDGFHRGHEQLLASAVAKGRAADLPTVLVTFHPHPLAVVAPERAPAQLMSVADRVEHAHARGAHHVVVLPFDRELAAMSAEQFVRDGLVGRLGCRSLVVGSNFRCGRGGAGDVAFLAAAGRRLGFDVEGVDLVRHRSRTCSSTAIRKALAHGDLSSARELLGRDDHRVLALAGSPRS